MMKFTKKQRRKKFTLTEIIVVMLILASLMSIGVPMYFRHVESSKVKTAQMQIKMFGQALMDYRIDMGDYPDASTGLEALFTNPGVEKWDGPYLNSDGLPKDPWGSDYIYNKPGENNRDFDIISYGSDAQPGGTGNAADIIGR